MRQQWQLSTKSIYSWIRSDKIHAPLHERQASGPYHSPTFKVPDIALSHKRCYQFCQKDTTSRKVNLSSLQPYLHFWSLPCSQKCNHSIYITAPTKTHNWSPHSSSVTIRTLHLPVDVSKHSLSNICWSLRSINPSSSTIDLFLFHS